jgi:hypothetical protein
VVHVAVIAPLTDVEARALVAGEIVMTFVERHSLSEGDEFAVAPGRAALETEIKPAYRRWIGAPLPEGDWIAVVEAVHPAALLDPVSGASRHVLTHAGDGDVVMLRVYDGDGTPVLSDEAFAARVRSIEGALNR